MFCTLNQSQCTALVECTKNCHSGAPENLNMVLVLVGKLIRRLSSLPKIWRAFSKTKRQPHSVQILYYCLLVFRARNFCPHETFIDKHVCTICSSMHDVEKLAKRVSNKKCSFQNLC